MLKGAATIKALTADQTRNEPQKHEAGGEVSAKTVAKLEETQRILQAQSNAYQAGGERTLETSLRHQRRRQVALRPLAILRRTGS
ncbi:hypothetical protein AB5I41_19050 [Sphingomonas sp. MMS24-JH45]